MSLDKLMLRYECSDRGALVWLPAVAVATHGITQPRSTSRPMLRPTLRLKQRHSKRRMRFINIRVLRLLAPDELQCNLQCRDVSAGTSRTRDGEFVFSNIINSAMFTQPTLAHHTSRSISRAVSPLVTWSTNSVPAYRRRHATANRTTDEIPEPARRHAN
jgi:hypothetical protein